MALVMSHMPAAVQRPMAKVPTMCLSAETRTSGTTAKGIPKLRTTWLRIRM